jgi:hypothetical protein
MFERDYRPEARRWKIRKRENVKMRLYVTKFGFAPWSHGGNAILTLPMTMGKENISENRASKV